MKSHGTVAVQALGVQVSIFDSGLSGLIFTHCVTVLEPHIPPSNSYLDMISFFPETLFLVGG